MCVLHSNLENLTGKVKRKIKKTKWRCSLHASHLPQVERHCCPHSQMHSNCVLSVSFQVAVNGANLQNVFMLLTLEPLLARSPFLVLHVRRNNLVGDALRELSIHSDIDLKKPLKVSPSAYSSKYLPSFSLNCWSSKDLTIKIVACSHSLFISFILQEFNHLLLSDHQITHINITSDKNASGFERL